MPTNKHRGGFTLIEMVVVVAIMAVFFGLSIVNYNSFTNQKKFDSEVKRLIDVIELAKSKAKAGDVGALSCDTYSGYQVVFNGPNYYLRLCCNDTCSSYDNIASYAFPSDVTLSLSGAPLLQFYPLTYATNLSSPLTVTVKSSSLGKCVPITVSINGLVDEGTTYGC